MGGGGGGGGAVPSKRVMDGAVHFRPDTKSWGWVEGGWVGAVCFRPNRLIPNKRSVTDLLI